MPPITIVFVATGLAVWLNAFYFLGLGAKPAEGGRDPLITVGIATFVAGLVDLLQAGYIMAVRPEPLGTGAVLLSGLIVFYGLFFTLLGWTEITGGDLRPVANLAIGVAIGPLFWWKFFNGGWMFHSILILWIVTFLAVAATVYGKLPAKVLGLILLVTSIYAFLTPAFILALGHSIP